MADTQKCAVATKDDKLICTTHDAELIPQSIARERGLTLDQPFLNAMVCPVAGSMWSSGADVREFLDKLENG